MVLSCWLIFCWDLYLTILITDMSGPGSPSSLPFWHPESTSLRFPFINFHRLFWGVGWGWAGYTIQPITVTFPVITEQESPAQLLPKDRKPWAPGWLSG